MKKGFTLIELLAVIVVLATIALIAVPTILGIIEKSRKGALMSSANGLVDAGILYHAEYQNENTVRFDIKNNEIDSKEENKIKYKGNIKEGTILVNNSGEVVVCVNDGKYAVYKNFNDNKVTLVEEKTCNIPDSSSVVYLDSEATEKITIEELKKEIDDLKKNSIRSISSTVLEELTVPEGGSIDYVATQDCYAQVYLHGRDGKSSQVLVDGILMAETISLNSTIIRNAFMIPLLKGQTLTVISTPSQAPVKIYAMK